jgi:hypothetical protein
MLDFEAKFFVCCSIAFLVQRSWHTYKFLYHSKQNKNEENMGFETREGLTLFFFKKYETKYHNPFYFLLSFFSLLFFF